MIKLKKRLDFIPYGVEERYEYLILRCSTNWRIPEFQSIVDDEVDYSECIAGVLGEWK